MEKINRLIILVFVFCIKNSNRNLQFFQRDSDDIYHYYYKK